MAPYRVDIGSRSRTVGRFVARVRNELLKAVNEERDASKINSQGVANRLDWHRSAVNRQLSGDAPLTLRSVAELSWALGREINFELHKPVQEPGQNFNMETTTIEWNKPMFIAMSGAGARSRDAAKQVD